MKITFDETLWQLVPKTPTQWMKRAGGRAVRLDRSMTDIAYDVWAAMLEEALEPESAEPDTQTPSSHPRRTRDRR